MLICIYKRRIAQSCSTCYTSLHINEPTLHGVKRKNEKWNPDSASIHQVGTDNNSTKAIRPPRQNAFRPSFTNLEMLHIHALPTLRVDKGNETESISAIYSQKRKTSTIHSETKISLISPAICIFLLAEEQERSNTRYTKQTTHWAYWKTLYSAWQLRNKIDPKAWPKSNKIKEGREHVCNFKLRKEARTQ